VTVSGHGCNRPRSRWVPSPLEPFRLRTPMHEGPWCGNTLPTGYKLMRRIPHETSKAPSLDLNTLTRRTSYKSGAGSEGGRRRAPRQARPQCPGQRHPGAVAALQSRTQPRRAGLDPSARTLPFAPRSRRHRGHHRRLLPSMDRPHRGTRSDAIPLRLSMDHEGDFIGSMVLSIGWRLPGPRPRRHQRPKQPAMHGVRRGTLKPPSRTTRHETPQVRNCFQGCLAYSPPTWRSTSGPPTFWYS